MGRVPFRRGSGIRGRGARGRGDGGSRADGCGSASRGSNVLPTSRTTPMVYRLQDNLETPESPNDSVGTSFPTDVPLVRMSGPTSSTPNASPSTTLVADAIIAADATGAAHDGEDDIVDELDDVEVKIQLRVIYGKKPRFEPSVATMLGKILRSKFCEEGSNWTNVTKELKEFYWEEFKKYYKWPNGSNLQIKDCWKVTAGKQYRDFINDRKKDSKKQEYIPLTFWRRWTKEWNTPEALELSRKKREARMGKNGQCSKHSGGSITASEHSKRFEIKNKRKPTHQELFDLMHRRKADKDFVGERAFVDQKSASIDAAFKARKMDLLQQSDGSPIPSDDDIYLEVAGGINKDGDVYGIGSQSSSIDLSSCSSSDQQEDVTLSAVQEMVKQQFVDFEQRNDDQIVQRIGKEVQSLLTPYQSVLLQVQDLLARLPSIPEVANLVQVLNDQTGNAETTKDNNVTGDDLDGPTI